MKNSTHDNDDGVVSVDELKACTVKANRIEIMKRVFKTHQSSFNFDTSFCKLQVAVDVDRIAEEEKEKKFKKRIKKEKCNN